MGVWLLQDYRHHARPRGLLHLLGLLGVASYSLHLAGQLSGSSPGGGPVGVDKPEFDKVVNKGYWSSCEHGLRTLPEFFQSFITFWQHVRLEDWQPLSALVVFVAGVVAIYLNYWVDIQRQEWVSLPSCKHLQLCPISMFHGTLLVLLGVPRQRRPDEDQWQRSGVHRG